MSMEKTLKELFPESYKRNKDFDDQIVYLIDEIEKVIGTAYIFSLDGVRKCINFYPHKEYGHVSDLNYPQIIDWDTKVTVEDYD